MKKCPYCGAEYPDDLFVCPVDQTPFDKNYQPPIETEAEVRPVIRREIPTSLSVVSYLFFTSGVFILVWGAFIIYLGGSIQPDIIVGILAILMSRGLRQCSRFWRFCALVVTWLGFLGVARMTYQAVSPYLHSSVHKPADTLPVGFLCVMAVGFLVQIWQYRVLTRSEVRDLFYSEP